MGKSAWKIPPAGPYTQASFHLLATSLEAGHPHIPQGGRGWPVRMLKASPTLLAPQLPPGMLRRGRAADKGRCGPPDRPVL